MAVFANRTEAGRALAQALRAYADRNDVTVLGLPRGGVPVAYEVARKLKLPLDVLVVRKLGAPDQPELAMGAIASGGTTILNPQFGNHDGVKRAIARETLELARRERSYRGNRPPPDVAGRTVIVVDDGAATGATMLAALSALRKLDAAQIVAALPTAAADTCVDLEREADTVVCLSTPEPYGAVGRWYEDFSQTSDEEVMALLAAMAGD